MLDADAHPIILAEKLRAASHGGAPATVIGLALAVLLSPRMPETTNWRGQIKRNCNREVCRTTANAILILRNTWGPHIVYDTFMGHVRMTGEPKQLPLHFQVARSLVGPWTDLHTTIACAYLEHPHELSLPPHLVRAAVEVAAASHPVHPVRDWLGVSSGTKSPALTSGW